MSPQKLNFKVKFENVLDLSITKSTKGRKQSPASGGKYSPETHVSRQLREPFQTLGKNAKKIVDQSSDHLRFSCLCLQLTASENAAEVMKLKDFVYSIHGMLSLWGSMKYPKRLALDTYLESDSESI